MSTTNYNIGCLSEVLSPITHMKGSEGNESILSRVAVATPQGVQYVPTLSGNQLRHCMVREPGWRWLIDQYGLAGKLTLMQLNFMIHGGAITEGTPAEDLARVADWQRLFPLGRMLGGCLPDQVLSGSLRVNQGVLVCREAERSVLSCLPDGTTFPRPLRSAASLVGGWQYTRSGSAGGPARGLLAPGEDGKDDLMIFAGQSVIQGAAFVHGFTIHHGSRLELGALLWSLHLWADAGAVVGGMSARGHGRLATSIISGVDEATAGEVVEEYKAHALASRDEAVDWLGRAFAKKADAKPKTKKGA